MNHFSTIIYAMILMMFVLVSGTKAQGREEIIHEKPNAINVYVGIFDLNLNYERNIAQRPRSLSKLRLGFGYAMLFGVGSEGNYINAAFVHLFGAKSSHLELDAGLKYMLSNSISDPAFSEQLLPEIFVGYRFEEPKGGLIFRAGLNYPTLINLGIGCTF